MKTKDLAEMIKSLHKQRLDEYQVRARKTSVQLTKTLKARKDAIDSRNQPKGGNDVTGRYKPGVKTEEKVDKKSKAKDLINTSPEQDSAMIGTQ